MSDDSNKDQLLSKCVDRKALTPANYTLLHAGGKETDYFDLDALLGDQSARKEFINRLVETVRQNISLSDYSHFAVLDKEYGPVGMLPYTYEISERLGLEPIIVQIEHNIRLEHLPIKGVAYQGKDSFSDENSIIVIDDVVTTGDTQREAIKLLEEWGGSTNAVICAYARDEENLKELELNDDLSIDTTAAILTESLCEDLGLLLKDNLEKYIGKNTLEKYDTVFNLSEETKTEISREAEVEVETMIQDIVKDQIESYSDTLSSSEKDRIISESVDSFNKHTKKAFENFYIDSKLMIDQPRE